VFLAAFGRLVGKNNALRRPKKVKKAMEAQYNQEQDNARVLFCCCVILVFRSCK
jgi:hypothetical protein